MSLNRLAYYAENFTSGDFKAAEKMLIEDDATNLAVVRAEAKKLRAKILPRVPEDLTPQEGVEVALAVMPPPKTQDWARVPGLEEASGLDRGNHAEWVWRVACSKTPL